MSRHGVLFEGAPAPARSALASVAAHGSVSYGRLTAERLREILLGSVPAEKELPCVFQALSETPLDRLATMAREIEITMPELQARFLVLFDEGLEDVHQWRIGAV